MMNYDSSILSHLYKLNTIIYRSSDYIFILFNRIATYNLRILLSYLSSTHIMLIVILFYNLCLFCTYSVCLHYIYYLFYSRHIVRIRTYYLHITYNSNYIILYQLLVICLLLQCIINGKR